MKKSKIGSNVDDYLKDRGLLEEVNSRAIKKVIAEQLLEEMKLKNIKKIKMAELMKTSRSTLDRLLDPEETSINLTTIEKAAEILGKRVELRLV
ncbi:MAG: helix-turn-helix domain-containing protein [Spirochaetaceae bacterium]